MHFPGQDAVKPFNHSAYWRNRALLLSIGCWTVLVPVIYYGWPDRAWNGWPVWVQIFLLVMFVGATLGLIAAFWLHIEARAFERLQAAHRGGKVLVRWRLSAEDWERFKALSAREGVLPPDGCDSN